MVWHSRRFQLFLLFSIMGFCLLVTAPSWATLQCGDTIPSGSVTLLTHDLVCGGTSPSLTVKGGTILLLNNHTIDCQGVAGTVGIEVIGGGAIVREGTVKQCGVGVSVGGQGNLIQGVTATQNTTGFGLVGGSHSHTLTDNLAKDNNAGFTTLGGQTHDNEIKKNVSQNGFISFRVVGNRNTVKSNTAKNYSFNGFVVQGQDSIVTANRAFGGAVGGSMQTGFIIQGDHQTVIQNLAKDNIITNFSLVNGTGMQVLQNTAKNSAVGIVLQEVTNSQILGNIALNHTTDLIDTNANCDNNQWVGNRFQTSNQGCIQ